jgi:DMSO reductase family type II enzyme chaperone
VITNDTLPNGRQFVAAEQAADGSFTARERGQLYHFLELALAHPGEGGHEYFSRLDTEQEFIKVYSVEVRADDVFAEKGIPAAKKFFAGLRAMSYEQVEGAYIALFTNNYPHLPCPPYGSLFTAIDSEKRLEEMLAIKEFYQNHGVDMADSFDDLPDHLCVELEFMQLLCFREKEAADDGDQELVAGVRAAEGEFLDRYLLPFAARLAELAVASVPDNPYSNLLEAARFFLLAHREQLGGPAVLSSENIRS